LADELLTRPGDFASNDADLESGIRVIEFIADNVRQIGSILADPDIQRAITVKALATDLVSLRRWQSSGKSSITSFDGRFVGAYLRRIQGGQNEVLNANMELRRRRNLVTGRFWFGLGEGTIKGIVHGNRMTYEWAWGNAFGRGALTVDPDKRTMSGAWSYEGLATAGGTWELRPE
jgi:hypothetical protein